MYENYGLFHEKQNDKILRLPLKSKISTDKNYGSYKPISKIVLFGKRNEMKGYDKTLNSLLHLSKAYPESFSKIDKVVFIGRDFGYCRDEFQELKSKVKIEEYDLVIEIFSERIPAICSYVS